MASGLSSNNPVTWPDQSSCRATTGDHSDRSYVCLSKGVDMCFPLPAGKVQITYTPSPPKACPATATRAVPESDMASIKATLGQLQSRVAELDKPLCPALDKPLCPALDKPLCPAPCAKVTTLPCPALAPAPCVKVTTLTPVSCCPTCPNAVKTIDWPGCQPARFASGPAPREAILSDMASVQAKLGALQSRVQELDARQCPAAHPCCTATSNPAPGTVVNWPRCL